jgi:hypothetical protein
MQSKRNIMSVAAGLPSPPPLLLLLLTTAGPLLLLLTAKEAKHASEQMQAVTGRFMPCINQHLWQ